MHDNAPNTGGLDGSVDVPRDYFMAKLQSVIDKIHANARLEDIRVELTVDICDLFSCDRFTLYALSPGKTSIETLIKTGMKSFRDFSLPISDRSVAGFVALSKKAVNINDAYDQIELKSFSPGVQFLQRVDKRTGYRTKEMLVCPVLHQQTNELLGVLQVINNRKRGAFSTMLEEGANALCNALAVPLAQRTQAPIVIRSKYDPLVTSSVLSVPELELATRAARRKGIRLEQVLVNDFQVGLPAIGAALSQFFGETYEPYREGRQKPSVFSDKFKREYVQDLRWLVLAGDESALTVMCTDPDRIKGSRIVNNLFPKAQIRYCVTTYAEFQKTTDQFFGPLPSEQSPVTQIGAHNPEEVALQQKVNKIILAAFAGESPDLHVELGSGMNETVSRFRDDGSLESIHGQTLVNFRLTFPKE
ncbi:MAG: GAF domain-containing protein [Pseudomonadota bacterium]